MKLTKEMEELRSLGYSYQRIADSINCSYGAVYNAFVKAGKHKSMKGKIKTLKQINLDKVADEMLEEVDSLISTADIKLLEKLKDRFTQKELNQLLTSSLINQSAMPIPECQFSGDEITIGALTDTHFGSIYTNDEMIKRAFEEFHREEVDLICHTGDVCEGLSHRPGHMYECTHLGYQAQLEHAVEQLSQWDTTPAYVIDGNHDRWFIKSAGAFIVKDICAKIPNWNFIGHDEGDVFVNGTKIKLWHGEDGSSYAFSYRIQKLVESLTGGEKPNVLLTGHTHKAISMFDRHIHCVSLGAMQKQSKWMRSKKHASHTGFWIIKMAIRNGQVSWFQPRWYPFYR